MVKPAGVRGCAPAAEPAGHPSEREARAVALTEGLGRQTASLDVTPRLISGGALGTHRAFWTPEPLADGQGDGILDEVNPVASR